MKTSNGYTTEQEARSDNAKYIVWYRQNNTSDTYYVSFTNKRDALAFAREHGINDPDSSPRQCGFCD